MKKNARVFAWVFFYVGWLWKRQITGGTPVPRRLGEQEKVVRAVSTLA